MPTKFKKLALNGIKVITVLWFTTHFLLTILYVLPLNPIKVRLKPLLDSTIGTLFSQNWSLFAPNPLSQDYVMLIHPLKNNSIDEIESKGWYNLSSPLWKRFQDNRFSAYDRLARSQSNALRNALSGDPSLMNYLKACENGDSLSCDIYQESLNYIREGQIEKLVKIGSAFCNDINDLYSDYDYFAIRIRIVSFPPWSKRHTEKSTFQDLDLGIHPIDKSVAAFGLFN